MLNKIMNWWNKIDKTLENAKIRSIDFYNNIISGIIGASIILYLSKLNSIKEIIINGIVYYIIINIFGLIALSFLLKHITNKNSKIKQIKNYFWNTLAAIIGGVFLIGIVNWDFYPYNLIISFLGITLIFITIMYYRNKR